MENLRKEIFALNHSVLMSHYVPTGIFLFKVNDGNTRKFTRLRGIIITTLGREIVHETNFHEFLPNSRNLIHAKNPPVANSRN